MPEANRRECTAANGTKGRQGVSGEVKDVLCHGASSESLPFLSPEGHSSTVPERKIAPASLYALGHATLARPAERVLHLALHLDASSTTTH